MKRGAIPSSQYTKKENRSIEAALDKIMVLINFVSTKQMVPSLT